MRAPPQSGTCHQGGSLHTRAAPALVFDWLRIKPQFGKCSVLGRLQLLRIIRMAGVLLPPPQPRSSQLWKASEHGGSVCGRSGLASHPCLLTLHSATRPRLPPGGAPAPGNLVSTDTCKPGEQGGLAAGLRPTSRVPPALRTAQSPDAGAGRTLPGAAPFANHSSRSRLRPVKPGEAAPPRGPAEDSEATPLRQGRAPHSGLLPPETEQLCGRTLAGSASNQHAECGDRACCPPCCAPLRGHGAPPGAGRRGPLDGVCPGNAETPFLELSSGSLPGSTAAL